MPLVSRTRATLRRAEFGFFGVVVYTRVQTPRRCGAPLRAGVLVLSCFCSRPLRTSWAMVGNAYLSTRTGMLRLLRNCGRGVAASTGVASTRGGTARSSTGSQPTILRPGPPGGNRIACAPMAETGDHAFSHGLAVLGDPAIAEDVALVAVRRGGRSRVATLAFARHLALER